MVNSGFIKCIVLWLLLPALLTSCGFHLRGTQGVVLDVDRVRVVGSKLELIEELEDTLKSSGVAIDGIDPEYVITVVGESLGRRAIATSGDITVSEFELQVRGVFRITAASGERLIANTEARSERIYSFDPTNFVSNEEEEALLVEEMRQDIAGQIVRRFSATLRSQSQLPADGVDTATTETNTQNLNVDEGIPR